MDGIEKARKSISNEEYQILRSYTTIKIETQQTIRKLVKMNPDMLDNLGGFVDKLGKSTIKKGIWVHAASVRGIVILPGLKFIVYKCSFNPKIPQQVKGKVPLTEEEYYRYSSDIFNALERAVKTTTE